MPTFRRIFLSFAISLALVTFSRAQDLQLSSLELVLFQMASHNIYESPHIGYASAKSGQYSRFEKILTLANNQKLIEIASSHPHAVIRLYGYLGLQKNGAAIPAKLTKQFQQDQAPVRSINGCVDETTSVNQVIMTAGSGMLKLTPIGSVSPGFF